LSDAGSPAQGQVSPAGSRRILFVSIKVAGYSGLLIASPFVLYEIIQFVLPGLTRRERRLIGPVVLVLLFYLWQDWYLPTYF